MNTTHVTYMSSKSVFVAPRTPDIPSERSMHVCNVANDKINIMYNAQTP